MLKILSWSSGLGCDKMQSPDYNLFAPEKQTPMVPSMPLPSYLKRKRSPSVTSLTPEDEPNGQMNSDAVQPQVQAFNQPSVTTSLLHTQPLTPEKSPESLPFKETTMDGSTESSHVTPALAAIPEARKQKMRQTISSQLSLEILLKHRELRLIDQELAKCQVALEQLRRCSEIPYPGMTLPSEQVSSGRGPALRRAQDKFPAESPAPWGVTDGPYSRHYAQWLLPDRRFDGGEPEPATPLTAHHTPSSSRSIRGGFTDFAQLAGKTSRAHRGSKHVALPAGYGEPKPKPTGPMIVKRKSDGKMVKLVCPDCGRHDFGSAQGFINHCRIGHQRNFASHDAAAEACGEAVEYDANGAIKGAEVETTPTGTNVHPLIRSARLLSDSVKAATVPKGAYLPKSERPVQSSSEKPVSPEYHGCGQTPHLSSLVKNMGMGLDLQDLVGDAKMKPEHLESDGEDDEMDVDSPVAPVIGRHPQVAGSKQPAKSVMSPSLGRSVQSKKHLAAQSRPAGEVDSQITSSVADANLGRPLLSPLLPSPTNESNQAPSLIDDDEEMDPQSPPSSDENDESDVHFHVRDDEHPEDGSEIRGSDLQSPPGTCAPTPAPRPRAHTRTSSAAGRTPTSRHEKHVSFDDTEQQSIPEGHERKRRKVEGK